ncbi:MAG: hypothetical protein U0804_03705 [Gemmataceae bacterium]
MIADGVRFLAASVRPDGSWPIDTNLATWVTTLSVNALAAAGDLDALDTKDAVLDWLLKQQYREPPPVHRRADPGGWAWTDLPGGVPDCDDTPGALLAVVELISAQEREFGGCRFGLPWPWDGVNWVLSLQNRDGGFPRSAAGGACCRSTGARRSDRARPPRRRAQS